MSSTRTPAELMVGRRKGLFTLRRGPSGWDVERVEFLAIPVNMLLHDPRDGRRYAALLHGHFGAKLHRTTTNHATWEECGTPTYPEGATISPPPSPAGPDPSAPRRPASMKEFWALETADPSKPGSLWAGTIPGGLFRSDDSGTTWKLCEGLWDRPERANWFGGGKDEPGIHSVCVDPRDPQRVAVAVSCAGVWETRDGGETWQVVGKGLRAEYMPPEMAYDLVAQDPHAMVRCPAQPDGLWIQHHNGVFKSDDGATTFSEITDIDPAVFGFAVAVHPKDSKTAWLAPAQKDELRVPVEGKLVVTRTRDGGATWTKLTNGLPQRHCYDIVYRHALAIDGTGECLAMGSTTGGLWVTENGGDAWTQLPMRLPPVYCVKFAE
jgi:hypothetical protein